MICTIASDFPIHSEQAFLGLIAIFGGMILLVVSIVGGITYAIVHTRHREQTKREIAAYVAEGSIEPEKAVEIIKAGMKKGDMESIALLFGKKT